MNMSEWSVDADGALSYETRSKSGNIVFAEYLDGMLDVGVYSDAGDMLWHEPDASESDFEKAING